MNRTNHGTVGRRRFLAALAAGGVTTVVAGCLGDAPAATPTPAQDDTDALPTDSGEASGDTSLAGSCAAAFGDTDQRYDPGDRPLVATFAYPMAGAVFEERSSDTEAVTAIGYAAAEDGQYEQTLRVTQRGPVDEEDVGERYVQRDGWEAGGTVTYDGGERAVAVRRTDDTAVAWVFGIPGSDGTYEIEVRTAVGAGDPCPDTYDAVCERVSRSFQPR